MRLGVKCAVIAIPTVTVILDDLNEIAEPLNNRPRKVLDFETPNEVFARLVAQAQLTGAQCCASA